MMITSTSGNSIKETEFPGTGNGAIEVNLRSGRISPRGDI